MQQTAQKIRNLIEASGLKQQAIAVELGMTPQYFNTKLKENIRFKPEALRIIADMLRVELDYLTDESQVFEVGDPYPNISRPPDGKPREVIDSDTLSLLSKMLAEVKELREENEKLKHLKYERNRNKQTDP